MKKHELTGEAYILGDAIVLGEARISRHEGSLGAADDSVILGDAAVLGDARIKEYATIDGGTTVTESLNS